MRCRPRSKSSVSISTLIEIGGVPAPQTSSRSRRLTVIQSYGETYQEPHLMRSNAQPRFCPQVAEKLTAHLVFWW
jgi:hypothetical protein